MAAIIATKIPRNNIEPPSPLDRDDRDDRDDLLREEDLDCVGVFREELPVIRVVIQSPEPSLVLLTTVVVVFPEAEVLRMVL